MCLGNKGGGIRNVVEVPDALGPHSRALTTLIIHVVNISLLVYLFVFVVIWSIFVFECWLNGQDVNSRFFSELVQCSAIMATPTPCICSYILMNFIQRPNFALLSYVNIRTYEKKSFNFTLFIIIFPNSSNFIILHIYFRINRNSLRKFLVILFITFFLLTMFKIGETSYLQICSKILGIRRGIFSSVRLKLQPRTF